MGVADPCAWAAVAASMAAPAIKPSDVFRISCFLIVRKSTLICRATSVRRFIGATLREALAELRLAFV
jgi:hypothetical protein